MNRILAGPLTEKVAENKGKLIDQLIDQQCLLYLMKRETHLSSLEGPPVGGPTLGESSPVAERQLETVVTVDEGSWGKLTRSLPGS
jgi:hypothetical protein